MLTGWHFSSPTLICFIGWFKNLVKSLIYHDHLTFDIFPLDFISFLVSVEQESYLKKTGIKFQLWCILKT